MQTQLTYHSKGRVKENHVDIHFPPNQDVCLNDFYVVLALGRTEQTEATPEPAFLQGHQRNISNRASLKRQFAGQIHLQKPPQNS